MNAAAAQLARQLRDQNVSVELGDDSFRLKKSFETAEKQGIAKVIIVGENEVASGQFAVKDLKTGAQKSVAREQLPGVLKSPARTSGS